MSLPVKGTLIFMLGLSIFLLYVVIERIITYSAASSQSVRFVLGLREHLASAASTTPSRRPR